MGVLKILPTGCGKKPKIELDGFVYGLDKMKIVGFGYDFSFNYIYISVWFNQ